MKSRNGENLKKEGKDIRCINIRIWPCVYMCAHEMIYLYSVGTFMVCATIAISASKLSDTALAV